jgi:DNA-directed RNA polymerase subunit M/transcription elongation factor TFIIS
MAIIDPSEAYRKLEEMYAEMSDSKLQEMADHADDLTEVAQQVLRAEISKRGLEKPHQDQPNTDSVTDEELVRVWVAKDSTEAQTVVKLLEDAGIPTFLSMEKIEYVDGSTEDKPVVKVFFSEGQRALPLLREYFPPEAEEEDNDDRVAVCPNCRSSDIVFQSLDPAPAPGAAAKFNWSCAACGHQWRDDGLEQLA